MRDEANNAGIEGILILLELQTDLLEELAAGMQTDALNDEITKSRIRIEKKKREIQRIKDTDKMNQKFRSDREKAEKERKKDSNCKN